MGAGISLGNKNHGFSMVVEANKLPVPTPPVLEEDTASDEFHVLRGKGDPNSVLGGMFRSFWDAPGVLKHDRTYSILQEEFR